jgi:hypothetical protein
VAERTLSLSLSLFIILGLEAQSFGNCLLFVADALNRELAGYVKAIRLTRFLKIVLEAVDKPQL